MSTLTSWTAALCLFAACAEPAQPTEPASGVATSPTPAASDMWIERADGQAEPPVQELSLGLSHAAWSELLARHVHGDRVNYAGFATERAALDAYIASLCAVSPAELARAPRRERFAFWINVYNAHVVALVLEAYPIASIRDLDRDTGSIWKRRFIALGAHDPEGKGQKLSLDVVEHEILRPRFEDARVHAAINCAAESCPALRAEAFEPARLEEQLDEQARAWLADASRNRFDAEKRRLQVSALFDWFAQDFARDAGSVPAWIARFAPSSEAAWIEAELAQGKELELETLAYSWKLNDLAPERR